MISCNIKSLIESPSSGVIRKMFEEGAALKKKFGAENVYDFSLGNPDLDPPEKVTDAIAEVCRLGGSSLVSRLYGKKDFA